MQEEKKFSKSELYQLFDAVGHDVSGYYNRLLGQLLTTVEATIEDERQAGALKERVKDIQGHCFEDLHKFLWGYHNGMSENDKIESPQSIEKQMQNMITSYMGNYEGRLINLVGAIVSNDHRLKCLTREIKSLVSTVAGYIRRAVREELKVVKEKQS